MARAVEEVIVGVDVSKDELVGYRSDLGCMERIANTLEGIERYLEALATTGQPVVIAVEATGRYHEALEIAALERGHTVYRVDGFRVSRFRDASGVRAKTDPHDARVLVDYLRSLRHKLCPVKALDEQERTIWRLIKRRAKVVALRTALTQGMRDVPEVTQAVELARRQLDVLIKTLERLVQGLARSLGWREDIARLTDVKGVGTLTAVALRSLAARGDFRNSDQFIAFLGLDVRVRESGKWKGKRKLTKKGASEIRRLLFNGARSAATHSEYFGALKQRYMNRGLSEVATSVILARKLARIAFALLRDQSRYEAPTVA